MTRSPRYHEIMKYYYFGVLTMYYFFADRPTHHKSSTRPLNSKSTWSRLMQFERQKLRSTNAVKDKNFNLPKKKLRSSNAACKTKASIFYAVRKKSRAAVIAGSKGCFLPGL